MVRSSERGAVVFGPDGVRYLDEDAVEGEDPAALFGEHTIMSLQREDAMTHAPDLLLLSQYDPEMGEVAAFEELIGSHGGLGGFQTAAVHPASEGVGARRAGPARAPRRSTGTSGAGSARSGSSSASRLGGRTGRRERAPRRRACRRELACRPYLERRGVVAWACGRPLASAGLSRPAALPAQEDAP